MTLLKRVIRKEPGSVLARILLGRSYLRLGNMREALKVSGEALSLLREGVLEKDARSLSQAIEIYGIMMRAWIGMEKWEEALTIAQNAHKLDPESPEAFLNLAKIHLKLAQSSNQRKERELILSGAENHAGKAIQYAPRAPSPKRLEAIIAEARRLQSMISVIRSHLGDDFPEAYSDGSRRSEVRGGMEGERARTKNFRRNTFWIRKFIRDEKWVIQKGIAGIKAILASFGEVVKDREKAAKILSRMILYGIPVTGFMIYGFPLYLSWSKVHPFWTGILTTSLLSGSLTQFFLQKYAMEPVSRSLNYYRFFYKTVFVFSILGAGLVAFYSGLGAYKGIDGMIPSTGLWPLLKLSVEQLAWSPFIMTLYQILVNFFEDSYQSIHERIKKPEQRSPQGSFYRPRLSRQVYQIMLINWPLWIPAHLLNYFCLQGLPGVRLIFVNIVAVIFYTILAFKIKTKANEKKIAELLGVPLETNEKRSLSAGLEALKVWAATLEQEMLSLKKSFRESLRASAGKRQEILNGIFSSVDKVTLSAVIEAEKMPLSKNQKRAAKYVIERRSPS